MPRVRSRTFGCLRVLPRVCACRTRAKLGSYRIALAPCRAPRCLDRQYARARASGPQGGLRSVSFFLNSLHVCHEAPGQVRVRLFGNEILRRTQQPQLLFCRLFHCQWRGGRCSSTSHRRQDASGWRPLTAAKYIHGVRLCAGD
jgi:hypothetical protein